MERGFNNLTPLQSLVKAYYEVGFCVLPVVKGTKRPSINWRAFQTQRPSLEETLKLFEEKFDPNLAVVCGKVSNLVVLDVDDVQKFEEFTKKLGIDLEELLSLPTTVQTGKGVHVYFQYPEGEEVGIYRFTEYGFEVRGDGAVVVAPPSLHPNGSIYIFRNARFDTSEDLIEYLKGLTLPSLPQWLLEIVRETRNRASSFESFTPSVESVGDEAKESLIGVLIEELRPFWTEGYRHELALGLGGWLARMGVPLEVCEEAVRRLVYETEDPELEDRLRAVRDMYRNIKTGGKVKGIPTLWGILGEEATKNLIRRVYDLLGVDEDMSREELEEEVIRNVVRPRAFPLNKLPGYLRRIVDEYSRALMVDHEYTASVILTIFSSAVGNSVWIAPKNSWRVPPFLWLTVVQETGGGKTPLLKELMYPLKELQALYWKEYERSLKEWKALPEEERKGREAPRPKHVFAEDFTFEALAEIFAQDGRGILIKRDELAGLIGALGQYKRKGGDDRQRLLELWDCEPWKLDRKGRPLFIPRTGASIIGGIQPRILSKVFNPESFDEGLIPRFLWLVLDARPRFWSDDDISDEIRSKYYRLLKWARELGEDGEELTIVLSPQAKERFKAFYNAMERMSLALPYPLKVFVPKLRTYTLKFALLHHLLKEAEKVGFIHSESEKTKIAPILQPNSIEFGIELALFFLWQAKRLVDAFAKKERTWSLENVVAETVLELNKETNETLIPIKLITERVNQKLNTELSTRAVGSILKSLGFTEENGLRRRTRTGNYAIYLSESARRRLSQYTQNLHPTYNLDALSDEGEVHQVRQELVTSEPVDATLNGKTEGGPIDITLSEENEEDVIAFLIAYKNVYGNGKRRGGNGA